MRDTSAAPVSVQTVESRVISDQGEPSSIKPTITFQPHGRGEKLLLQHCGSCHAEGEKKGGFSLEEWPREPDAALNRWRSLQQQITLGIMPPTNKPALTPAQRQEVLRWIDEAIFRPLEDATDPGPMAWRRLSRVEYVRTLHSLLGGEPIPIEELPADDAAEGYDTLGPALTLTPLHLEKYLDVTSRLLQNAVAPLPVKSRLIELPLATWSDGESTEDGRLVRSTNGELSTQLTLPADGEYELALTLHERPSGAEAARASLWLQGQSRQTWSITGNARTPQTVRHRFTAYQGPLQLAVSFDNDWQDPQAANPLRRDRDLVLVSAQLVGPLTTPVPLRPPWYDRLFPTPIADETDTTEQLKFAEKWLADFATQAWRRAVTPPELADLVQLYQGHRNHTSFTEAMLTAYQAILVSPNFIFRERPAPNAPATPQSSWTTAPLSDETLAVRLAYLLWSAPPDQALRQFAARKQGVEALSQQVPRLLAHPQAEAFREHFLGRWLQLPTLAQKPLSPSVFPEFDEKLRRSMQRETELFLHGLMRGDWPMRAVLTADFTHVDKRLAHHYGLTGHFGEDFQLVSLQNTPRRGLLGQAGILTLTSHPDRTSPTTRGKWVLDTLLGTPPPPAPQSVPPLEDAAARDFHGSLAEKLARHRQDPACAGCHQSMDSIGLVLESFDALGRLTSHSVPAGAALLGRPVASLSELSEKMARESVSDFLHHFTRQLLIYSIGRSLRPSDEAAVRLIVSQAEARGGRLSDYLIATVRSVPFSRQRVRISDN